MISRALVTFLTITTILLCASCEEADEKEKQDMTVNGFYDPSFEEVDVYLEIQTECNDIGFICLDTYPRGSEVDFDDFMLYIDSLYVPLATYTMYNTTEQTYTDDFYYTYFDISPNTTYNIELWINRGEGYEITNIEVTTPYHPQVSFPDWNGHQTKTISWSLWEDADVQMIFSHWWHYEQLLPSEREFTLEPGFNGYTGEEDESCHVGVEEYNWVISGNVLVLANVYNEHYYGTSNRGTSLLQRELHKQSHPARKPLPVRSILGP